MVSRIIKTRKQNITQICPGTVRRAHPTGNACVQTNFFLICRSLKREMKGRPREEIRRNARTPALLPNRRNSHSNSCRKNSPRYARQKSSARGQMKKNTHTQKPRSRLPLHDMNLVLIHSSLPIISSDCLSFFSLIFSFIPARSRHSRFNLVTAESVSSLTLSLSMGSHVSHS